MTHPHPDRRRCRRRQPGVASGSGELFCLTGARNGANATTSLRYCKLLSLSRVCCPRSLVTTGRYRSPTGHLPVTYWSLLVTNARHCSAPVIVMYVYYCVTFLQVDGVSNMVDHWGLAMAYHWGRGYGLPSYYGGCD